MMQNAIPYAKLLEIGKIVLANIDRYPEFKNL